MDLKWTLTYLSVLAAPASLGLAGIETLICCYYASKTISRSKNFLALKDEDLL